MKPTYEELEQELAAARQRESALAAENWNMRDTLRQLSANSPEIPEGWVLVPREPTEEMIIQGFESAPDEFFSPTEVWEEYQAMSGCKQAAHRAKLCWSAMIAAAPLENN